MLNSTYTDITAATEQYIDQLFATNIAISPAEIRIKEQLAKAALDAWSLHAAPLVSAETHGAEYERLGELVNELPLAAVVAG